MEVGRGGIENVWCALGSYRVSGRNRDSDRERMRGESVETAYERQLDGLVQMGGIDRVGISVILRGGWL